MSEANRILVTKKTEVKNVLRTFLDVIISNTEMNPNLNSMIVIIPFGQIDTYFTSYVKVLVIYFAVCFFNLQLFGERLITVRTKKKLSYYNIKGPCQPSSENQV